MDRFRSANASLYDAFLRETQRQDGHDCQHEGTVEQGLEALCADLPACQPAASLRARMLAGACPEGRLARFASAVAQLLDIGMEQAETLLDRALRPSEFTSPLPGIGFLWVSGGPRVADAIRGFVRVQAGRQFPEHEHLGRESLLVLQGTLWDGTRQRRVVPGELDELVAGSSHAFHVPADGPDLLGLAVTHVGMRVLGLTLKGGPKPPL